MTTRNIRTINQTTGQKIESEKVLNRIGHLDYRNMGLLAEMFLFNSGKGLIVGGGLLVTASSGMTVSVSAGNLFQRLDSGDIIPGIGVAAQTITLNAANGSARTDTIQCQITSAVAKTDTAELVTDQSTGTITVNTIYRDRSYSISIGKLTSSTTATPAAAGVLTGTVAIPGTINLSAQYLLNLAIGEDGSFVEVNLQGANPSVTTLAEIIAKINAAAGFTMASAGPGSVLVLTGSGVGQTSYFEIKPPSSNSTADAFTAVTGVLASGFYTYTYQGTNAWVKIAEIDVGAATTTITTVMIRNLSQKSTWASDSTNVLTYGIMQGIGVVDTPTFQGVNMYLDGLNFKRATIPYSTDYLLYKTGDEATDITFATLRKYPIAKDHNTNYTMMRIVAPDTGNGSTWGFYSDEATLALIRTAWVGGEDVEFEYMDLYNNGYASETQFGIRMQKRNGGTYRNFVFDYYDGSASKVEILKITPTGILTDHIGELTGGYGIALDNVVFILSTINGVSITNKSAALYNIGLGNASGGSITIGQRNNTFGFNAGKSITYAMDNNCIGYYSGGNIINGNYNICIGTLSNVSVSNAHYRIAIGTGVIASTDHAIYIGELSNYIWCDYMSTATWSLVSDGRKKKNIKENLLGLNFISRLNPKSYQWKSDSELPTEWSAYNPEKIDPVHEKIMNGLIAQDVKKVLDDLDIENFNGWSEQPDGMQMIGMTEFILPLINAVKELKKEIDNLKKSSS